MTIRSKLFSVFLPLFTILLGISTTLFYTHYKNESFKSLKPLLAKFSYQLLKKDKLFFELAPLPVLQIVTFQTNKKSNILFQKPKTIHLKVELQEKNFNLLHPKLSPLTFSEENLTPIVQYTQPLSTGGYLEITMLAKKLHDDFRYFLLISLLIFIFSILLLLLFIAYFEKIYSKPMQALSLAGLNIISHKLTNLPTSRIKEIQDIASLLTTLGATINEQSERLKEGSFTYKKQILEIEMVSYLMDQLFTKPIERFDDESFEMSLVELQTNHPWGSILNIKNSTASLNIEWSHAQSEGIQPLVELLQTKKGASIQLSISKDEKNVHCKTCKHPPPLLWSTQDKKLKTVMSKKKVQCGDILLIINAGLERFLSQESIELLAQKIIPLFQQEGLKAVSQLIAKELQIKEQKSILQNDARMLLIQIKK